MKHIKNPSKIQNPFSHWSKHQQRDRYVVDRWKILSGRNPASYLKIPYQGKELLLVSQHCLNEPHRPNEYDQNLSFLVFDVDGHTIWNGYAFTSINESFAAAYSLSYDKIKSLLGDKLNDEIGMNWIKTEEGKYKRFKVGFPPQNKHVELGGLTRKEFEIKYTQELFNTQQIKIYPEYSIDKGYEYGLGLRLVVDEPYINNLEVLSQYVLDFFNKGKKNSVSTTPAKNLANMTEDQWYTKYKSQVYEEYARSQF